VKDTNGVVVCGIRHKVTHAPCFLYPNHAGECTFDPKFNPIYSNEEIQVLNEGDTKGEVRKVAEVTEADVEAAKAAIKGDKEIGRPMKRPVRKINNQDIPTIDELFNGLDEMAQFLQRPDYFFADREDGVEIPMVGPWVVLLMKNGDIKRGELISQVLDAVSIRRLYAPENGGIIGVDTTFAFCDIGEIATIEAAEWSFEDDEDDNPEVGVDAGFPMRPQK
jgi:hypothetical protein